MYRTQYSYPQTSLRNQPSTNTSSNLTYSTSGAHRTSATGAGGHQSIVGNQPAFLRQTSSYGFGSLGSGMNDSAQLDLNDFPALGTTQTTGSIASREGLGSYAAQAQHHASTAASGTTGPGSLTSGRDFTNPDDFPALGGASAGAGTGSGTAAGTTGENGFVRFEDKRVYGLKQVPSTPSSWAQSNGLSQLQQSQAQTNAPPPGLTTSQPQPPPGLTSQQTNANLPPGLSQQQQQQQQDGPSSLPEPASTTAQNALVQPHTPADQVLHSPADRWGLLALVRALRMGGDDALSSGVDLGGLGMEMGDPGSLYPKFATPWASYTAATPQTEPNYHLPSCYNVQPPPPNPKKAAQFSDETLFFTFYALPRDAGQEVAAQELYNRNWRYHKTQRIWVTTDQSADPTRQTPLPVGPDGSSLCTVWDVESWERQPRMMRIDPRDLEVREPSQAGQVQSSQGQGQSQLASAQAQPQQGISGPSGAVVGSERTGTVIPTQQTRV